jgi:predicted XRE-type DNA-binding protein
LLSDPYPAELCSAQREKRIYDWNRRCYVTVWVAEVGKAPGISQPATKWDVPLIPDDEDDLARWGEGDELRDKIAALIKDTPMQVKQIAEVTGLHRSKVYTILKRYRRTFCFTLVVNAHNRDVQVWSVKHEVAS